jgi:hypothetical protein
MTMTMTMRIVLLALLAAPVMAPAAVCAQADERYSIMRPEPGRHDDSFRVWRVPVPKPVRRAHGSSNPVYPTPLPQPDHFAPTPEIATQPPLRSVQPYVMSPQSGRVLPNLDQGRPESGQDRAMRCAHQAGVYGEPGGSYLGACINQ